MAKVFLLLIIFLSWTSATWDYNHMAYTISEEGDQRPGLTAHVQNWATLVQNYILQVSLCKLCICAVIFTFTTALISALLVYILQQ